MTKHPTLKGFIPFPGTSTFFKIGGSVRLDVISDDTNNGNPNEFVPSSFPVPGQAGARSSSGAQIQAKPSRVTFELRRPVGEDNNLRVYYESDFFGASSSNTMTYRLRHFYGQAWNFLVGQTFSNFMEVNAFPDVVDYEGPNSLVNRRQPQVRYTQPFLDTKLQLAVSVQQRSGDNRPRRWRFEETRNFLKFRRSKALEPGSRFMRTLLCLIVATIGFAASLSAGVPAPTSPSKSSEQPDDSIHTPAELVQSMRSAFGNNLSRAVHAKGIILEGDFTPDPHAKEVTKAQHLQGAGSKITVRFSDFSGDPTIADNAPMANPRGMAVRFHLPGGSSMDLVALSHNGFPVSNTDDLRELMLAIAASGPSTAAPTALDRFLDLHPATKRFIASQKTPASFATISYFGVGCLKFTNAKKESHYVRYQLLPEAGEELLKDEQKGNVSPNYLMDEIRARVAVAPIVFELYAQVSERGDNINDPSIAWPDTRRRVPLGKLEIKNVTPNTVEEDRALVFTPNNVPDGIQIADPLLVFYSKAFRLSAKEVQDATAAEK